MNQMLYPAKVLAELLDTKAVIANPASEIRTLITDSRKVADTQHALFFALQGRRDGHQFLKDVYQAGVHNLVVSDPGIHQSQFPLANLFLVDDTLAALQKLAAHHRKQFTYPVIGITGSNGKTIVKEWLYQLLAPENRIVRSPKSYNSQMGVPVSVWQMNGENTLAIFEAGISKAGEMENLAKVIRPDIGILTSVGEAHNEGFRSREEKISEKLKLFKDAGVFVYNWHDLENYHGEIPGKRKVSWGYNDKTDLKITESRAQDTVSHFIKAIFKDMEVSLVIPFTDHASIQNCITCFTVLLTLGYDAGEIAKRTQKLLHIKMRLEMKSGINNCSVIDDSYSLDLSSLAIALDFLKQQNQHLRKTLVLSDIPESGMEQSTLYERVAQLLQSKPVNRLIGVGENIGRFAAIFPVQTQFFPSTEELIDQMPALNFSNETILLKGARVFGFEKISKALTQKVHETVLEINLNAVEHNLNYYKARLKPGVKLMAMVKAFSYGSGSYEIASLLQFNKIDYLAVAYTDEGVSLRKAGITLPLMVMNPDVQAFEAMIDNNLEPEIYSMRILKEFIKALGRKNIKRYPIHLKLDTGMHRLGFMEEEANALTAILNQSPQLHIQSIFSHLAAAGDAREDDFTRLQIARFQRVSENISQQTDYRIIRHIANTSAIDRWPDAQFDMVRLGIGLYGIDPADNNRTPPLQTVTVLKTSVSQVKTLQPGETVGYNRQGKLPDGGKIATVKIGYADGYSRKLGNGNGKMLVNGNEAPTIGTICMDMCMLNVTGMAVQEGDEVIVFDSRRRVEDIARSINTIPYEILTGISQRVKRVYYYE